MQGVPDDRQEPDGGGARSGAGTAGDAPSGAATALRSTWRAVRRVVIAVVGSVVLLAGLVLLVTPGPAFVVIPIGLGILAIEFPWARRWLDHVRTRVKQAVGRDGGGEKPPVRTTRDGEAV